MFLPPKCRPKKVMMPPKWMTLKASYMLLRRRADDDTVDAVREARLDLVFDTLLAGLDDQVAAELLGQVQASLLARVVGGKPVMATKPAPRSLARRAAIRPSGPGPSTSTLPPNGISAFSTAVSETASGSVRQADDVVQPLELVQAVVAHRHVLAHAGLAFHVEHVAAELGVTALAVLTDAAHRAILDDDFVAGLDRGHVLAGLHDLGGDLVSERHVVAVPVAHEVDVGAAHAAGVYLDNDVILVRRSDVSTRSCTSSPFCRTGHCSVRSSTLRPYSAVELAVCARIDGVVGMRDRHVKVGKDLLEGGDDLVHQDAVIGRVNAVDDRVGVAQVLGQRETG